MKEAEKKGGPRFKDFRTTSDGVMVADVGFKKQLWALDPELDVVWDWASARWEIWKFPGQKGRKVKRIDHKAFHVMTIQTKKRTFRELGADILLKLQAGDPTRYSLKEFVAYFDQMDENIQRAKERAFNNKMEALHNETFWYTRGLRKTVPRNYEFKPSEKKLLLNVEVPKVGEIPIIKQSNTSKIINAVSGGSINA